MNEPLSGKLIAGCSLKHEPLEKEVKDDGFYFGRTYLLGPDVCGVLLFLVRDHRSDLRRYRNSSAVHQPVPPAASCDEIGYGATAQPLIVSCLSPPTVSARLKCEFIVARALMGVCPATALLVFVFHKSNKFGLMDHIRAKVPVAMATSESCQTPRFVK